MSDNGRKSLHLRNEQHFTEIAEELEMRENGSDPSAQGGGIQDANDQQEILKNDKSCVTPPIRAPDKHMDTKQNLEQQAKHAMETVDKYWTALSSKYERLQEVLQVEHQNMSANELKLNDDWEALARTAKMESLHRDMEVIWQGHNAEVDRKNAVIQVLERGLDEAGNQFSLAIKSHSATLDYFIDQHSSRLLEANTVFEDWLKEMQTAFQNDRECIEKMHDEEMVGILRLISAVKNKIEESSVVNGEDLQQVSEQLQNHKLEKLNNLRTKLETKAQNIDEQLKAIDAHYNQSTMELSAEFKQLSVNDEKLRDEINVKAKHIERLQVALRHWRDKMSHNVQENDQRSDLLNKKRNSLANQYQALKRRMNESSDEQHRRLVELSHDAMKAKTRLVQHLERAERISRLAEICDIKMTEEKLNEVMMGKYNSMTTNHDEDDNGQENLNGILGNKRYATSKKGYDAGYIPMYLDNAGERVQPEMHLENFLRKLDMVQLDKISTQKERDRLESENKSLKCALEALDKNNSLAVNGKCVTMTTLDSCGGQILPKISLKSRNIPLDKQS